MNSADLLYHECLEPSRTLELERWGGILSLCVLSGSITIDRIEGLRTDDAYRNKKIGTGCAIMIFGPGWIRLDTGQDGAEIFAQGTSDVSLIDAIPPDTPAVNDFCMDITELNRIKRLASRSRDGNALYQLALSHERFSALAELCAQAIDNGLFARNKDARYVERTIEKFRENIESPIRLPDLAWQLGITEEYLTKLFHAKIGMPPMKYFRILKIEEAERLLSEGNYSVKEVSWRLGFASQYHFSKTFKAIRGYNPSECRSTAERRADTSTLNDLGKEVNSSPD